VLIIRPYCGTDERAVVELWETVFPGEPGWNHPVLAIKRKLSSHPELFLVAVAGDELVGTTIAGIDGTRAWIYYVAVAPNRRREGIGTELMKAAESAITKLGYSLINLQVRQSGAEAVRFYETLGYYIEAKISMARNLS
jgi:ribosomal protein S18 acetylase RimI-like enzyme